MTINDVLVIFMDSLSVVCLGLLGVGSIAGVQIQLAPWEVIALFVMGKAASTTLSYLKPPGSARRDAPTIITPNTAVTGGS